MVEDSIIDFQNPPVDTFLDFKNRTVKRMEKLPEFQGQPDFEGFFKKEFEKLGIIIDEDGNITQFNDDYDKSQITSFLEAIIAAIQMIQQHHELLIKSPRYITEILEKTTNSWVKIALQFVLYHSRLSIMKKLEIQEKYYIIVPLIEQLMRELEQMDDVELPYLVILILIYKVYTTALQRNKFLDDVDDLFVTYVNHIGIFEHNNWKNSLLDNFYRMVVQVGLMLKRNDLVVKVIEYRKKYLEKVKNNLVFADQDQNVILNIININFSISKNYLQLNDTDAHEVLIRAAESWLDGMMKEYPFTKKAWKMKVKMIRSMGHNALKRRRFADCYRAYLKALVLSYLHNLPREFDRAKMYVAKYQRFFFDDHIAALKHDLKVIDDRLSQSHLLYLIGKMFTERKKYNHSMRIQRLMVDILEEEYHELEIKVAIEEPTKELNERWERTKELYGNNLDYMGNLLLKRHQVDAAAIYFLKEIALLDTEKPKKRYKIFMKIAKDYSRQSRYKEGIEFAERALNLAKTHNFQKRQEKALEFLVQACKLGDYPSKLANYKKLLYQ